MPVMIITIRRIRSRTDTKRLVSVASGLERGRGPGRRCKDGGQPRADGKASWVWRPLVGITVDPGMPPVLSHLYFIRRALGEKLYDLSILTLYFYVEL